jgi:hypothetical protein
MATDPTQPAPRLEPARQRVRIAKWALVLTSAASFGTAATVLARTGDSGTATPPSSASVTLAGLQDDQGEQGSDDLFGGASIAPPDDFGGSLPPRVGTHTS